MLITPHARHEANELLSNEDLISMSPNALVAEFEKAVRERNGSQQHILTGEMVRRYVGLVYLAMCGTVDSESRSKRQRHWA
jgi:hypothetical protein